MKYIFSFIICMPITSYAKLTNDSLKKSCTTTCSIAETLQDIQSGANAEQKDSLETTTIGIKIDIKEVKKDIRNAIKQDSSIFTKPDLAGSRTELNSIANSINKMTTPVYGTNTIL